MTGLSWIPTDKTLPDSEGEYIVTVQYATESTSLFWTGEEWQDEFDCSYPVTAWMPYPEVYREEKG